MKFSIVILFVLGIIAAACAAVLMGVINFSASTSVDAAVGIDVAMANVPLPAMTPITSEHISVEKVSKNELPKGQLVNATSVIGRVLAVSVYEGQILTESCFVPEGSANHLIAQIPHGMRAFAVYVNSRSMPDKALLSPGCIVDVLVSYRLSSRDSSEGEALSTTMLRGIQVLAVSGELVVTEPIKDEEEQATTKSKKGGESKVTLLVDTSQAEALQLAQNNGDILLTIRNPNDKNEFDEDPSILNKSKLTPRGADLPPAVLPYVEMESNLPAEQANPTLESGSNNLPQIGVDNGTIGTSMPVRRTKSGNKYDDGRNPLREITVIRGAKKEVEHFDDAGDAAKKSAEK
ncbi:MAG: Flp pilus assembly protein CpaB [Planctomycetota bacterium]|jgi:pilus assembly protein CpaB